MSTNTVLIIERGLKNCFRTTFPGFGPIKSKCLPDECPVVAEKPRRHEKELIIRASIFCFIKPFMKLSRFFIYFKAWVVHLSL